MNIENEKPVKSIEQLEKEAQSLLDPKVDDGLIKARWVEMFNRLIAFKKETGSHLIPNKFITDDGAKLGGWFRYQRQAKETAQMPDVYEYLMEREFGENWDDVSARGAARKNSTSRASWNQYVKALQDYKEEFGDVNVSARTLYQDLKLGNWLVRQRRFSERLSDEQIEILAEIGITIERK
ncbi:helicase associated domain-containing protein [Photobacterium kishitanii]|uniref:Helicase-associated domain-containing protein n=1 Tax=Photobacterium kishitanii TaxID=318456 RepID=A0A2T3KLS3_9GAMM|nr:helicase associated domain-containing protein [Photobacterium kishitanii]PSV00619.1 hypothetical protein C9J27_05640 [Photobacterium kishitanii]